MHFLLNVTLACCLWWWISLSWKVRIMGVHLVCVFCTFRSRKRSYYKKLKKNCVWLSQKRNFLIKVAFWAQAKNAFKTRNIYGLQEVHKSKRACTFELLLLGWWWIMKISIKIPILSRLKPHTPHLISLLSLRTKLLSCLPSQA